MTHPQEKLAAELRAHASDCRKAADLNTDVVLQFDQLAAMAEAMDSAATTLLSEHGGGGEAVIDLGDGGKLLNATLRGDVRVLAKNPWQVAGCCFIGTGITAKWGIDPTTPPTPSAPVVDDAMIARAEAYMLRVLPGKSTACLGGSFNFHELLTAALSGVSAPVGVEGSLRRLVARLRDGDWNMRTPEELAECVADAIMEALATPAVEGGLPDVHEVRRLQDCERAWQAVCDLLHELVPNWSNNSLTGREAALETIRHLGARRLAASGQGVEWQPIETAPKDSRRVLLARAGWPPYVGRRQDDDWIDEDEAIRDPQFWMPLPAAPMQEESK